jgi:hypothetical protein
MAGPTSSADLRLAGAAPDATIALAQGFPSLGFGRSRRPEHPILRPGSTDPVEPTI